MTRAQRRLHLWAWIGLAAVLAAGFIASLWARAGGGG
jgi:hypothetical protein